MSYVLSILTAVNATRIGIIYNPWMRQHFVERQALSRVFHQELHTSQEEHITTITDITESGVDVNLKSLPKSNAESTDDERNA